MLLLSIIVLLLVVGFWWNATQAKDIARRAAIDACKLSEVWILDDAVALRKLWLHRNEQGRVEICRFYFFDFSLNGEQRYQAYVLLQGSRVTKVSLDPFE